MKLYITLVVIIVGILGRVKAYPAFLEDSDENTVWPIPQRNGSIRWMTEEEAILEAAQTEESDPTLLGQKMDKVRFFLYTQDNPSDPIELFINDEESFRNSTFDYRNPTRFMNHGWMGSHEDSLVIREALLLNGYKRKLNFISVDWSVYAQTKNYISAKSRCSKAGQIEAEFIDWLHDNANLSFDTLGIYGHSLGAHVAGFTGKNVKRGRIHTIVGLDPAMPLFRLKNPDKRLSDTDGEYVETIHTNGGILGFYNPIGKASFYPNGGRYQPGCGTDVGCSHGKVMKYFSEALRLGYRNGLTAIGCKDFDSLKSSTCDQFSVRSRLGDPRNAQFAEGIYYLETNSEPPYAIRTV